MNHTNFLTLCVATALLGACGSSDDASAPVPPVAASDAIPDTASQSAAGMVSWINRLAAEEAQAKEALDVAKFAPPTADNTEPLVLN